MGNNNGNKLLPHEKQVLGFLGAHLAGGVLGALLFGGLCFYFDIAMLRTLIWTSDSPVLYAGIFLFGLAVTFGSVAMAVGVMSQGEDRN